MQFDQRPWLPRLALSVCICASAGCVQGPDYVRPQVETPSNYRFADPASTQSTLAELPAWWRAFGDSTLDALVEEGLAANHDLLVATARVDEFAAVLEATQAQGLPLVGYGGEAGRQRAGTTRNTFAALFSASWELDLWGRIARETEAARASLLASDQARLGVALTVVSTIVSSYVTLLDLDRQLEISLETVEGRKKSVNLFQTRFDGGAVSEFELMQVTADYEGVASAIPELRLAIAQLENALSVLLGRTPGPIRREQTLRQLKLPPVPAGLPSDLITRRPDILQSEQQLIAANALIGAARALYFPSVSLTASGGRVSSELDDLFSGTSRTWSYAGNMLGPLFAGGAIDAANLRAEAQREQALEIYQKTIQAAFREVDDSLAAIQYKHELVETLGRRVVALQRAVVLSNERYDNGYTDYLSVLDAQRSLFTAQLAQSTALGDGYRALVNLYRALGGDWIGEVAPYPRAMQPAEASAGESSTPAAQSAQPQL